MMIKAITHRFIKPFVLISTFILLFSSCGLVDEVDDTNNETDNDTIINSTTVGTDGGIINADELTLTIPAGAFSQTVEIIIYSSSDADVSMDDIATKVYSIEGLPDQYSTPIDVRIRHNGITNEQAYLILQEETYIPSLDSIFANNIYFEAVVAGDSLISQIPAITTDLSKGTSLDAIYNTSRTKIYAIHDRINHTTSGNHFNIVYSPNRDDATNITTLGQYLEDAYTKLQGIGFSCARRTTWPVQVHIEILDAYGYHVPSRWGLNSSTLQFNSTYLSDQTAMKTTAIHEYFHLIHYLYDNRNFLSRATFAPPHHWFNEACAVWSEELVTNPQYMSETRSSFNAESPFTGLQAGSEADAEQHGYGMSAFIKYIANVYGQNVLVNIYDKLFAGKHVVDAINQCINEMLFIDYNLFLQQYAHGQLYPDVGLPVIKMFAEGAFEIASDADTLKTFSANSRELSGNIYSVKLDNPNFKDDTSLEISIDQELCHITVFQYPEPNSPFNVVAEGSRSCVVSDLKDLKAQNKHLLVMVVNGNLVKIPEYSPSTIDITVRMEVKEESLEILEYAQVGFAYKLEMGLEHICGNSQPTSPNYHWENHTVTDYPNPIKLVKNGNTYSGSWEYMDDPTNPLLRTHSGSITFTLRDNENIITQNGQTNIASSVELIIKSVPGDQLWYISQWTLTMTDVEYFVSNQGNRQFNISGQETCNHISLEWRSGCNPDGGGGFEYTAPPRCSNDDARVSIGLSN
ncbi:MAG: hypothetical protein KJ970_13695 [Candidatus Eisenbacteria bacterium]|uniref:Uncharacterized protein n=1 Tax=Eiseniibacteriota bacterium TaxID=2212470 RepID=A0A948RVU6_UNCEI|nr:hypothetical protein [Candidatus Eisenbacteria bacterium]MBU2691968.1 hypothetical protein [Candidatus Eisenbacteria bacterium]